MTRRRASMRTEPGEPMKIKEVGSPEMYAEYIDWRAEHPSDDLMTDMLHAEFEDETGTVRRLTREEILTYCGLIASAGNETAGRLIGWIGKVLADHPDQRRELVDDPSLIPDAVEEVLRFEPPGHNFARYVSRDVELHGTTVPEGSVMLFLIGAANRDERRFPDGDRFDIHRNAGQAPHLRLRHPLLPRCRAGAARGSGRSRRDPQALPRMGDRRRQRPPDVGLCRPGLGDAPGVRSRGPAPS